MPERPYNHSEEVQEILGHIPHWIIRWGITVLFSTLCVILVGSYFFRYPQKVEVPLFLTMTNAPASIVAKTNGRIEKWLIRENEDVEKETPLVLLESPDLFSDLQKLEAWLNDSDSSGFLNYAEFSTLKLPSLRQETEGLSDAYQAIEKHKTSLLNDNRVLRIRNELVRKKEYYNQINKQRKLKKRQFTLLVRQFQQDSTYYHHGGYGVTKRDYESSLLAFLREKSAHLQYLASFSQYEAEIEQLEYQIEDIKQEQGGKTKENQEKVETSKKELRVAIKNWRKKYLLNAPISGRFTKPTYWSDHQFFSVGEVLATIVPQEAENKTICRAFVSASNLGRIQVEQKVIIKLDGFPYLEHGTIAGVVSFIGLVPVDGKYLIQIDLPDGTITTNDEELPVIQEMTGIGEILTDETRLLYKLIGQAEN